MEGVILCLHLLVLQQAVFPAQTVTLQPDGTIIENSDATLQCVFTAAWNTATLRQWIGPGSVTLINNGVATNAIKYAETIDSANNLFSMKITNYNSGDDGNYQCQYGFTTSNTYTLSTLNTQAHPPTSPLESVVIPYASEAIDLTISVPGVRPTASASFNLTSAGTLTSSDNAVVTVMADANGRTSTCSVKIDVAAGTTNAGDIFTITLVVGDYSVTKQWTIAASIIIDELSTGQIVLTVLGVPFGLICMSYVWILYLDVSGKITCTLLSHPTNKCKKETFECSRTVILVVAIVVTVLCVSGIILCIVGTVTTNLILTAAGFAVTCVVLIFVIVSLILIKRGVLKLQRCDAVDVRKSPDGQEGKLPTTESKLGALQSVRSTGTPTSASNIKAKWKNNQVSDSNESDGSNASPRGPSTLDSVPTDRKLPALDFQIDASQKPNALAPIEVSETRKLKKKKKKKKRQDDQVDASD